MYHTYIALTYHYDGRAKAKDVSLPRFIVYSSSPSLLSMGILGRLFFPITLLRDYPIDNHAKLPLTEGNGY